MLFFLDKPSVRLFWFTLGLLLFGLFYSLIEGTVGSELVYLGCYFFAPFLAIYFNLKFSFADEYRLKKRGWMALIFAYFVFILLKEVLFLELFGESNLFLMAPVLILLYLSSSAFPAIVFGLIYYLKAGDKDVPVSKKGHSSLKRFYLIIVVLLFLVLSNLALYGLDCAPSCSSNFYFVSVVAGYLFVANFVIFLFFLLRSR